jgi:hypothetical protein
MRAMTPSSTRSWPLDCGPIAITHIAANNSGRLTGNLLFSGIGHQPAEAESASIYFDYARLYGIKDDINQLPFLAEKGSHPPLPHGRGSVNRAGTEPRA